MTPDRNHTASVTDTNGSQTSYTYNASTEQLTGTSTYNPETGKTISTNRVYNASNGRQTQMYIDGALSMSYAYKNGGLSSLTRKSYRNGIGQWQSYGLAKDVWGNTSAVTVSASTNGSTYSGTRTLASYTYAANNGNLTGMTCGNGDSISYSYDSFDRLIKTRYNDTGDEILYTYNAEGSLAQLELRRNSTTVGIFSYEYDSLGRLIRSRQTDGTNTIQRTEHLYDAANRLKQQNYTVGNKSFTTNYTYSSTDGLLTSMKTAQGATIGYTYDGLKRQKKTTVTSGSSTVLTTKYAYRTVSGDQTSTQPEYYKVIKGNGDGMSTATILEGAKYTYDAAGNITMISESISPFRKLVEYQYDKQNQLDSAKYYTYSGTSTTASSTTTYTYAYDTAGNLLTEKKNGATVKTYTYGDSGWNDLLTSFRHGGKTYSISYDGSGNPTSYPRWQDNTSYYMSWSNGRQLTYMDYATTASNETQIRYAYDANGIRSSKKVNNTVHSYVTQSGKVIRETIGSGSSATIMDFIYDNQGLPFALNYFTNNGSSFTTYYYVLNLQGDVVKLVDGSGTSVASYAYDAWGKILSSSGSKAEINPLRYRGYYYDTETGFYYVSSRYYDLRCPDVLFGVLVDGIVIGARADTEQMPAVAEQAVVRPVGRPGADRRNGDIVNKAHDQGKDRQSQPAVRDHAVDLIGGGELAGVLLLVAALHQGGNIDIALVRDDALGIVVQLLLGSLDVLLNVRLHIGRELELCHGLLVALEDLDGVPALLLLRHLMHSDLFDVGQRMLDRTGERVHRNGLRALGGLDGGLGSLHDAGALQGGDLNDLTAKLAGQLCGIDLIAVFADDVHHVDGDDDRDAQLGELRGEVQVALEVRAVDDVQDRIGTLADQIVTGDDLLQRVRRQGVDTGKVGDRHTVVLLELAFLLFHGDAGPVANELVRTGQRVEQRRLAAVRVARKGNSNVHFASSLSGFQ